MDVWERRAGRQTCWRLGVARPFGFRSATMLGKNRSTSWLLSILVYNPYAFSKRFCCMLLGRFEVLPRQISSSDVIITTTSNPNTTRCKKEGTLFCLFILFKSFHWLGIDGKQSHCHTRPGLLNESESKPVPTLEPLLPSLKPSERLGFHSKYWTYTHSDGATKRQYLATGAQCGTC